jgi:putative transposase
MGYSHSWSSVGQNKKHVQLTPKYRFKMMRKEMLKVFCKVALEEACKRYSISLEIIEVMDNHVHMIVDLPRTMSDAEGMRLIKGFSSYLLFRICPDLRKRYPKGHFWSSGYFCASIGVDYEQVLKYIENQDLHHH